MASSLNDAFDTAHPDKAVVHLTQLMTKGAGYDTLRRTTAATVPKLSAQVSEHERETTLNLRPSVAARLEIVTEVLTQVG